MATMTNVEPAIDQAPAGCTLLELVTRLTETTDSAEETVEAALDLLDSGRVYLTGNFRGCRLEG